MRGKKHQNTGIVSEREKRDISQPKSPRVGDRVVGESETEGGVWPCLPNLQKNAEHL